MAQNEKTQNVSNLGVSIWLDDLSRERINQGSLQDLIATKNVVGVTTNPAIFGKAIMTKADYNAPIEELAKTGADAIEVVKELTTKDVADACEIFTDVYNNSGFSDGRVSIEVDPRLAHDGAGTITQAEELYKKVNKPNVMIKIPAIDESIPAITETLAKGISVNVTLIFTKEQYLKVIEAYILGIQKAKENGHDLNKIHSVASFFVSRVDTAIDAKLDAIGTPEALELKGKSALANARVAYEAYENAFNNDPRWAELEAAGGKRQRPLWASTGVKNPDYSKTLYVDGLVGGDVVNTMPEATLNAVAEVSVATSDTLSGLGVESAAIIEKVKSLGIDFDAELAKLESDGVASFISSWQDLLDDVQGKIDSVK